MSMPVCHQEKPKRAWLRYATEEWGAVITLRAYIDESHSDLPGKRRTFPATGFFVMGAYIGRIAELEELERKWVATLAEENIKSFHMSDLPRAERKRERVQHRFFNLIKTHEIRGVVAVIALKPFFKFAAQWHREIGDALTDGAGGPSIDVADVHLFASQIITNGCTRAIDLLPADEQIFFVFDRHIKFEGVEALCRNSMVNTDTRLRHRRIGDVKHASRTEEVLLQAADALAHEEYQYRIGQRGRWQRDVLWSDGQVARPDVVSEKSLRMLMRRARHFIDKP